jgi:hypothetical protein
MHSMKYRDVKFGLHSIWPVCNVGNVGTGFVIVLIYIRLSF